MARLSKDELVAALRRLGETASERGLEIDLVLVGGAAMLLRFGNREATKDVDVVVRAPAVAIVRELATRVAEERGWPDDWLNDAAKGYVGIPSEGPVLLDCPGIVARAVSVEQMLGMKLGAWRDDLDISDSRLLLRECRAGRVRDELWRVVEPFVTRGREQTAWYAFQDLWDEADGAD